MKHTFLLLLLLIGTVAAELYITEVMPNSGENGEWIEVYTTDQLNFSGFLVTDNHALNDSRYTDRIICCSDNCSFVRQPGEYFVIGEDDKGHGFDYCIDSRAFAYNGLSKSDESVYLHKNSRIYAHLSYDNEVIDGYSLSLFNSTYLLSIPTPGKKNIFKPPMPFPEIENNLEKGMTDTPYYLFKLRNNFGQVNATFYYNISMQKQNSTEVVFTANETVIFKNSKSAAKFVFTEPGAYTICSRIQNSTSCYSADITDSKKIPCNISLWIEPKKNLYEQDEKVEYYVRLSNTSFYYEIEYWIEDIFGKIVKSERTTTNTNKRSYTPKFDEKEKAFFLNARLSFISCNNSASQIEDEFLFAAKGGSRQPLSQSLSSDIEIDFDDSKIYESGTIIIPKLKITKGDTSKYLVKVYAEGHSKISEDSKIYIYGKNKEADFSVPVLLDDNIGEPPYYLVAEGLGITKRKKIKILQKEVMQGSLLEQKQFEILYFTKNITNRTFSVVKLQNPGQEAKYYEVWSYIYSGAKCYSGEREKNLRELVMAPFETKTVLLENCLEEIPDKEIRLKVKLKDKATNKTKEISEDLFLARKPMETKVSNTSKQPYTEKILNDSLPKITGRTIYRSSNSRLSDFSAYFLAGIVILGIIALFKLRHV